MNRYRLCFFKSIKHFYIQVFDDRNISKTIIFMSTLQLKLKNNNLKCVKQVVDECILLLKKKKINKLYFKRKTNNRKNRYSGKIKYSIEIFRKADINI